MSPIPIRKTSLVTVSEASQRTGFSMGIIRSAIYAGRLPAQRAGTYLWLIAPADIEEAIREGRLPGRSGRPRTKRD